MKRAMVRGHRGGAAGILVVGGAALAAAIWVSGDHGWAMGALGFMQYWLVWHSSGPAVQVTSPPFWGWMATSASGGSIATLRRSAGS